MERRVTGTGSPEGMDDVHMPRSTSYATGSSICSVVTRC